MFPKFSKKREGPSVICEQKLLQQKNDLILNTESCTGCGVCAEACPEEAITVTMVGATKREKGIDYASPIEIDEKKCSYCGVCAVMCPFSALTLKIDDVERLPILEKEGFPQWDQVSTIDQEKCIKCTICEDVCPRDAIVREVPVFEGTSAEGKKRQTALQSKTTFEVDKEKCTYCGICGSLCPAITVKRKEFSGETGKVEGEVLFDETKCDACKVCVEVCPEECITVNREVVSDKLQGEVNIDKDLCCTCTWCSTNCPTEAITVEKLFDGEIRIDEKQCPSGCSTCVEVCPCNAIYLPSPPPASDMHLSQEAKIAVNKDLCIFCGACVNACPGEDIIFLKRTDVRMKGKETDLYKRIKEKLCLPRTSKVKETVEPGETQVKVLETS